jgi:hypothetical protein
MLHRGCHGWFIRLSTWKTREQSDELGTPKSDPLTAFLSAIALLESLLRGPHNQLVTTTVEVAEIDVGTTHVAPGLSLSLLGYKVLFYCTQSLPDSFICLTFPHFGLWKTNALCPGLFHFPISWKWTVVRFTFIARPRRA